jgi:nucleoside-diphosphate-sugar epimerase
VIVGVTGASGVVGRFVVAELQRQGARVRAWRREGTDCGGFEGEIEWIPGELGSRDGAKALVEGADAVVHGALAHEPGRYRGGEGADLEGFVRRNVQGSLELMLEARRAGVGRFVFLSSRAVYGDRRGEEVLSEEHCCLPDTHYGAAKRAVEAFVQSLGLGDGWQASALRATGVYGVSWPPRRSKWWGLARALLEGRPWDGPAGGTEVHGADLARAVWLLLTAEGTAGQLYNCSERHISTREVAALMQRQGGLSGPLPAAPAAPPRRVPDCTKIRALGLRFGGLSLLESTAGQLLALARQEGP